MTDYISRKAAYDAIKLEESGDSFNFNEGLIAAMNAINSIPAADVRPVVLCKDCRHRDPEDHKCDSGQLERAGCAFPVDDDYFCAYGER